MNEENFTDYLKKVSNLYKISYEELKTLVHQYPYCQNLHQLLVEKSKLEEHEHYEQNLARASTYTNDRPHLFRKLQQIQELEKAEESVLAHDEYLELPNLKELGTPLPDLPTGANESAKPPLALDFAEEPAPSGSGTEVPDFPRQEEEGGNPYTAADEHPAEQQPTETTRIVEQAPPPPVDAGADTSELSTWKLDTEIIRAIATALRVVDTTIFRPKTLGQKPFSLLNGHQQSGKEDAKPSGPRPKASFPSWVQQFQPNHVKLQLGELMEAKKMEDKKKDRKNKKNGHGKDGAVVEKVIQQSVMENPDLASETLAELLVAQMQYEKAISVYERLILKFPEKSSFFAEKISNLKKLMV
jgi:hypothetical protein